MAASASGFATRLAYGTGQAAEGIKVATLGGLLFFYYSQVLGLPPTATAFALFCGILGDTVGGILAGSASDRLRHRRGRRHPLMLAAALPTCLALVALFWPPAALHGATLFCWLFCWLLVCRVAMTFFTMPHFALGADMAESSYAKTANVAFRQFFHVLGGIFVYWSARELMVPTLDFPIGQVNPEHYPTLAIRCATTALVAMLIATLGTWHLAVPAAAGDAPQEPRIGRLARVADDFRQTLRARPFRRLLLCVGAFAIAAGTQRTTEVYVATYFWELPTARAMLLPAAGLAGSLAGVLCWTLLSRVVDKRSCYIGGTSAYALLAIALPCVHALGLLPPVQSAQFAAIVLGSAIVSGLLSAAPPVFIGAMIADVIDVDETATGRRRAASFFGTAAIVAKPAVAVSTVLAGALLAVIGLDGGAGSGAPQSSLPLGLLSGALVALFALTAALSMRRYAPAA